MEIIGTSFILSLGAWKLRFVLALEDADVPPAPKTAPPHHVRIVADSEYAR